MRLLFLALCGAAVLLLNGCCTLIPYHRTCKEKMYATGWTHLGAVPKAPCTDTLLAVAEEKVPCPAAKPLHGVVVWYAEPFMCDFQKVWGCSDPMTKYVSVDTATAAHVSDSALAEEVAHWIWPRCFPTVKTEWTEKDPVTGKILFKRDPAFQAWFMGVRAETRARYP